MKIVRIFLLILALLVFSACSGTAGKQAARIEELNAEETYPSGPFSLDPVFSSLKELYDYADVVIEGHVETAEVVNVDGFPQTHSLVSIDETLKGDPSENAVTVMEEGGASEKIGSAFLAVPLLEPGQHLILFLVESELPGFESNYYIAGAFQGKFIEREGYFFQQATSDVKLPPEEYDPLDREGFIALVRSWS